MTLDELREKLDWEGGIDYLFHEVHGDDVPEEIRQRVEAIRAIYLELDELVQIE
jgi:hypothetical protein